MRVLIGALAALLLGGGEVRAEGYAFAPDPTWLSPVEVVAPESPAENVDLDYLLVDDQVSLLGAEIERYRRVVYRVVTEAGTADGGRFSVEFQPEHEQLFLHAVEVERNGKVEDRAGVARMEIMRREEDLEDGLIDGMRTLSVLIPDVRVGDRVEFRYTLRGFNPVFGGRFHDVYSATYGVPVRHRRVVASWPNGRQLYWRSDHPAVRAVERKLPGRTELVAEARPTPKVIRESEAPAWSDPNGSIELSEFKDWSEVVRWAVPLYPRGFTDKAARDALIARIGGPKRGSREALLAAVAFVQGQIRYTGIEIGPGSHAPTAVETTLQRGYGDCKDKSQLLVSLLAALGIEAVPVLVSTSWLGQLDTRQPGPMVFDHVIVRARLGDETVWIDPTRAQENGDLAERAPVRLGLALPIAAGTKALVPIDVATDETPDIVAEERIALVEDDAQPTRVEVETVYRRGQAERQRYQFADEGVEELARHYLQYMREDWDNVVADADPVFEDDKATNRFVVRERYRLEPAWTDADGTREFTMPLFQLRDFMEWPKVRQRRHPLSLEGARHVVHRIAVKLDETWDIEEEANDVKTPWFHYRRQVTFKDHELVIEGTWRRLADHVEVAQVEEYLKRLGEARDLLSFQLTIGESPVAGFDLADIREPRNWVPPLLAFVLALALVAVALRHRDPDGVLAAFFAPRAFVRNEVDRDGARRRALWVMVVAAFVATVMPDERWDNKLAGIVVVGVIMGTGVMWLLLAGAASSVLALGLQLFGVTDAFRRAQCAVGWAQLPFAAFGALALLAMWGRYRRMLIEDTDATAADLPALCCFVVLLGIGLLWTLLNQIGTTAGAARLSLVRAALAVCVPIAVLAAFLSWLLYGRGAG